MMNRDNQESTSSGAAASPSSAYELPTATVSSANTVADVKKVSQMTDQQIVELVEQKLNSQVSGLKEKFSKDIQDQTEKVFVVLTILTAVLAFIATEASLMKIDNPNAIVALSLIFTGGLVLFTYLITSVIGPKKPVKTVLWISITLIIIGIVLTGWSPRQLVDDIHRKPRTVQAKQG